MVKRVAHLVADDETHGALVQDVRVQTERLVRYDEHWVRNATAALRHKVICKATSHFLRRTRTSKAPVAEQHSRQVRYVNESTHTEISVYFGL